MIRYISFPQINDAPSARIIKVDGNIKKIVPFDSKSNDYAEYLVWLSLGNIPEPFENL